MAKQCPIRKVVSEKVGKWGYHVYIQTSKGLASYVVPNLKLVRQIAKGHSVPSTYHVFTIKGEKRIPMGKKSKVIVCK